MKNNSNYKTNYLNNKYNYIHIPKDINDFNDMNVTKLYLYLMFRKPTYGCDNYIVIKDVYEFLSISTRENKNSSNEIIRDSFFKLNSTDYFRFNEDELNRIKLSSFIRVEYIEENILINKTKYGYVNHDEYLKISKGRNSDTISSLLSLLFYFRQKYCNKENKINGTYRFYSTISEEHNININTLSNYIRILKELDIIYVYNSPKIKLVNTKDYFINVPNIFLDKYKYKYSNNRGTSQLIIDDEYNPEEEAIILMSEGSKQSKENFYKNRKTKGKEKLTND